MAKAKDNRSATEEYIKFPKPGPKKKKKQLGFKDPPLDYCQVCGIHANPPYVTIERHHIKGKKMGGRNDSPEFHSPENRIDVCSGPCSNNCHKKADQKQPGYTPEELIKRKEEDEERRKMYEALTGAF